MVMDKEAEITADKKNSQIIVSTALPLNGLTEKYLTTPGRLQFFECYSINDLAHNLKRADSIYYTLEPESLKQQIRQKKNEPDTAYEKLKKAGVKKPGGPDFPEFDSNLHNAQGQTNYSVDVGESGFSIAFSDSSILLQALFPSGLYKEELPFPTFEPKSRHDTAKLVDMLRKPEIRAALPPDFLLSWLTEQVVNTSTHKFFDVYTPITLKSSGVPGHEAVLEGDIIKKIWTEKAEKRPLTLNIQMNGPATKVWDSITKQNIGKFIALAVDKQVYAIQLVSTENKDGLFHTASNSLYNYFPISDSLTQYICDIAGTGSLPLKVTIIRLNHIKSNQNLFYSKKALLILFVVLGAAALILAFKRRRKLKIN